MQSRQIGLDDARSTGILSGQCEDHLVEPAFEHRDPDDAARGYLFRQVGVAEVVAELALQVARHRRGGVDQILVAAPGTGEALGEPRQGGAQRRRRALVDAVGGDVDRQLLARLAQLARHGRGGDLARRSISPGSARRCSSAG